MQHEIHADSNNKTIAAKQGDEIMIRLEETPATGYMWEVDEITGNACEHLSSDYSLYADAAIGGGGTRTISFRVNKNGNCRIRLKNWQRWTGDVYQRFDLGVTAE